MACERDLDVGRRWNLIRYPRWRVSAAGVHPSLQERLSGQGLEGTVSAGQTAQALSAMTPEMQARMSAWTLHKPEGRFDPLLQLQARDLPLGHLLVERAWIRASIKAHQTERFVCSDDHELDSKADAVGLYLHPLPGECTLVDTPFGESAELSVRATVTLGTFIVSAKKPACEGQSTRTSYVGDPMTVPTLS